MKLVKTILIFFFYVCCFNKYHFSESLCEDRCNLCEDCCNLCDENLYDNLDNNEFSAINIFCKLNKIKQYSISSIDNCEESTHECKKITLNNNKNEEFILFIKVDEDPTFVFESLKAIGMSKIDYVYYNGDFDFANLKNLNVYRFFCSLLGCSDCEPFLRIDNVYIKDNEVFLLDFFYRDYCKVNNLENFLSIPKIVIGDPTMLVCFKKDYLNTYKEEKEQAFWFSIKVILCRDYSTEMDYYDKTLNDGKEIKITYFLSFLKDYIKEKNPTNKEENQIFLKLKEEMYKNTFTNDFINFLEGQKETLPQKLENAKKENDEDKIAVFEKKINDATSILKKIEEGEKVE